MREIDILTEKEKTEKFVLDEVLCNGTIFINKLYELEDEINNDLYDNGYTEDLKKLEIDGNYPKNCEYWIVSVWLSLRLKERGELTSTVLNLEIWARQNDNPHLSEDSVLLDIAKEFHNSIDHIEGEEKEND